MTIRVRREKCPDPAVQAAIDKLPKFTNKEAKWLLVEALLSGEYKQASGSLRKESGFCCLGVATDVAIKQGAVGGRWDADTYYIDSFDNENDVMPRSVRGWFFGRHRADYCQANPSVIYEGEETSLASLNDRGLPFDIIAGIIINQL